MATYHSAKLVLVTQGITGYKSWVYADTGSLVTDMDAADYFSNALAMGAKVGDTIDCRDLTTPISVKGRFSAVDTGGGTIVLDTG